MKSVVNIVSVGAILSMAAAASAQTWNEVGDAGQSIAGAQNTTGVGALQFLNGTLANGNDVDIFCIHITDEAQFRAQVTSFAGVDSILWLFNTDGTLQVLNDDFNTTDFLSTITSQGVFNNGIYYLGISRYVNVGVNAANQFVYGNNLWPGPDTQQIQGNGTVLDHWSGSGNSGGAYAITLRGAEFCNDVPTPGAAALLGLGGLIVGRRRR